MFSLTSLREVKIRALRNKVWFKLSLEERSIIDLTLKSVRKVKSRILSNVLMNIVFKIIEMIRDKTLEIYKYGLIIAKRYASYVLKWGNREAKKWIEDEAYIFHLGISYINTPPIYKYETIKHEVW